MEASSTLFSIPGQDFSRKKSKKRSKELERFGRTQVVEKALEGPNPNLIIDKNTKVVNAGKNF